MGGQVMLFLAKLHRETEGGYSVEVVDLPGCFSAGDTLREALRNSEEAILCHLDGMLADGETIPQPDSDAPVAVAADEILTAVHVDLDKLAVSNKTVRLNVTIPERAVALIDHAAKLAGTSRSGFLTQAALSFIERHGKAG